MAANTQITINGLDYTQYIDLESVEVDNSVIMTHDTMQFVIRLRGELPIPADGNEVIWLNNGVREFAGVVTTIIETDIGTDLEYQITAQSYERWLDRKLVVGYYPQQAADVTVKQIIQQFAPQFTTNNVKPGFTLAPFYFNYMTVSDALKKISQMIEYGWYIDYQKDLHFYPVESFVSPLPNNTLDIDNDVVNYGGLVLQLDGSQKKTRIYLKGFKSRVGTPVTLNFPCDGYTMQWNLGYKPSRASGDVSAKIVDGNGNTIKTLTIKRDMVDGSPGQNLTDQNSLFVNYSQNLIRLNYAPPSGQIVQFTMYYLTDTIVMREDPLAQQAAAQSDGNGSDGIYEFAITEPALSQSTIDAANARGDQLLYKYAYPELTGTFTSYTQGWRAGQYFYLLSKRRMGGLQNVPVYVRQVKKTIVKADNGGLLIAYEVSFSDVPYLV